MAKLTEEMVIARSRQSDLTSIKKLNCWGSDLSDVTIIRRMRGVEVLALSVNQISTLADFEECEQLQELYLRKNNIQDLSELAYIQNLPNLRNLWLEENPCVQRAGPNYRMIVLRALPNLTKLDNADVTPEEVNEAMRAAVRRDEPTYEEPQHVPQQQPQPTPPQQVRQQAAPPAAEYRQTSPTRESSNVSSYNTAAEIDTLSEHLDPSSNPTSPLQRSPPIHGSRFTMPDPVNSHTASPTLQQLQQQKPLQRQQSTNGFNSTFDVRMRSPGSDQDGMYSSAAASINSNNNHNNEGAVFRERGTLASSISTQSMKEYYQSDYQRTPNGGGQYRHSQTDLSEWDEQHENGTPVRGGVSRRSTVANDRDVPGSYGNYGGGAARGANGHTPARDDWEDEKADRSRRMSSAHMDHRRSESRFADTTVVPNSVLNHYASMHRRPTHRNANLLSAALCLIKELDLSSLEVVEHAVRCRIDEVHAHAE